MSLAAKSFWWVVRGGLDWRPTGRWPCWSATETNLAKVPNASPDTVQASGRNLATVSPRDAAGQTLPATAGGPCQDGQNKDFEMRSLQVVLSTDWASCSRSRGQGLITSPNTSEHGLRIGSLCGGYGKSGAPGADDGFDWLWSGGSVLMKPRIIHAGSAVSASSSRRRECNGERNKRETDVPVGGRSERA